MEVIFRWLARWPLPWLHALGALLGWLAYALSPSYRRRFSANASAFGCTAQQRRAAIAHAGKMVAELPRLWLGASVPIQWDGLHLIEQAHQRGQGIVFLTPHLGCFEVTAQAYAQRYASAGKQITVLYRPARKKWLQNIMASARHRQGLATAPATVTGIKSLLKTLRGAQAVGILPDQVPPEGLGLWSNFFDRRAYSMTLPARLVAQTDASILLAWGERLPDGLGYCIHIRSTSSPLAQDTHEAVTQINAAMEQLIARCPEQYLWGYDRYKNPRLHSSWTPASGSLP